MEKSWNYSPEAQSIVKNWEDTHGMKAVDSNTLQSLFTQWNRHFVLGPNKRGFLWTIHGMRVFYGTTANAAGAGAGWRSLIEITFHEEAMAAQDVVKGLYVHGGAIAGVMDFFAAGTGGIALNAMNALTAIQSFKYRRPLIVGERYILVGQVNTTDIESGRSSIVRCALLDAHQTKLVTSETTMKVPKGRRTTDKAKL